MSVVENQKIIKCLGGKVQLSSTLRSGCIVTDEERYKVKMDKNN